MDEDDWMARLNQTADRFREEADAIRGSADRPPKIVKRRPYTSPSGATARSVKAQNAYQRVQRKQGGK